jgi:HEAT repeat protein
MTQVDSAPQRAPHRAPKGRPPVPPLSPLLRSLPRLARGLFHTSLFCVVALALGIPPVQAEEAPGEDARTAPVDPAQEARDLIAAMKSKDAKIRLEATQEAAENQDAALASALVRLLSDKDGEVRDAAILALGARTEPTARKKATSSLLARLDRLRKHPADRPELLLAIEAIGGLRLPSAVKPLLEPIDLAMDMEEVDARMNAVAAIPEKESIDRLIQFLARGRRGGQGPQRASAQRALQTLTGHRGNRDPDQWRAWWKENESTFSFDAIVAAREAAEAEAKAKEAAREARKKDRQERGKKKKEGGSEGGKKAPKPAGPSD